MAVLTIQKDTLDYIRITARAFLLFGIGIAATATGHQLYTTGTDVVSRAIAVWMLAVGVFLLGLVAFVVLGTIVGMFFERYVDVVERP